jgi:hypothetical protein
VLFLIFVFMATPSIDIIALYKVPLEIESQSFLAQFKGLALTAIPVKALAATIALSLFYWRFRLPFVLLPIAGSLTIATLATTTVFLPYGSNAMLSETVVLLLCGLAAFAAAMRFDLSDRLRTTRRSDCAFWLHLLAAPLIVHSLVVIATWWVVPLGKSYGIERMTANLVGAIAAIILVLALVAIIIDRRALLVSALTYLGAIVGFAITQAMGKDTNVFYASLLVLGILILTLGIGWRFLRAIIMRLLPRTVADRLPPVSIGT